MQTDRHSPEFQDQAPSQARTRGKRTLESVATERNVTLGTFKGWLKRSGLKGAALPTAATLPGAVPASQWGLALDRTAPHRTALHRTAPHRTAPHCTARLVLRERSV